MKEAKKWKETNPSLELEVSNMCLSATDRTQGQKIRKVFKDWSNARDPLGLSDVS